MAGSVPPRFNVAASLRDALHEVRLVRSCLDGQIDRLDRLERELVALLRSGSGGAGAGPTNDVGQVAHNLEIQCRPDGSAVVSIDGGRKFVLAQQLAEVLRFIASGEKDRGGSDPLVGWRSRTEILSFLADSAGRSYEPRYLNNLVHRLRMALKKADYHCDLIQTNRQKGVRFAFKHSARTLAVESSDPG
jgi:hypothetical protein